MNLDQLRIWVNDLRLSSGSSDQDDILRNEIKQEDENVDENVTNEFSTDMADIHYGNNRKEPKTRVSLHPPSLGLVCLSDTSTWMLPLSLGHDLLRPSLFGSSSSYLRGLKLPIEGKNPSLFLALPLSNLSLFLTGADELA
ncbi:hypothetical protein MRB53_032086 [Persea americana]|uniref:Uncharacterized protein n=1 Tax=Persea americana TaxID=3435 RepID=A0ACC2KR83_PERAE|nr:hypothetical protein MRB53_032086 [Persea americana]